MKKITFILLAFLSFNIVNAQEVKKEIISKKERKELLKTLTIEEKTKLLSMLIQDDNKLVEKTIKKALKKADKKTVDRFMRTKDLVFKPMKNNSLAQKSEQSKKRAEELKAKVEKQKMEETAHQKAEKQIKEMMDKKQQDKLNPKPTYIVKDKNAPKPTTVVFAESTFNFGELKDGEKVTHKYTFTNTGDQPYIISNAKGSCGCTVPQWPRQAIAPGESGEIVVTFNSRGKGSKEGRKQKKRITITGNSDPGNIYLYIEGNVIKPAEGK